MKIYTIAITFDLVGAISIYNSLFIEDEQNNGGILDKMPDLLESFDHKYDINELPDMDELLRKMREMCYKKNKYTHIDPIGWLISFHQQDL